MAPAPTATANRPMAQPSKTRYFKGKAPELAPESDSDEDNDDQEEIQLTKPKFKAATKVLPIDPSLVAGGAGRVITDVGGIGKAGTGGIGMKMELGGAKIGGPQIFSKPVKEESSEEEESEEEEEEEKPAPKFAKPPVPGDESSEYETDSEEESEEETKPAFRPVFIRKDQRGMTQEKAAAEAEARLKAEEELQAQRKADSKDLAGETIRRELAEREVTDIQPDVDDTDGLDPAAEFDAWQARELRRLVRDKEAQAARDLEKEEIERRRALPEDQRLREDMEFAQATRDREKGEMGFLQKYYHKGAFHQDDDLLKRDYTAATESAVDMSNLPSVMQVRDFGKRSRTKYTHLVDQDTSQGGWGAAKPVVPAGTPGQFGQATMGQGQGQFAQGCWNCGGDHMRKDCPNNNLNDPMAQFGLGSSSNAGGLGGSSYGRGGGPPQDYGTRERQPNRYAEDGRERRFDEQRRAGGSDRHQDRGYDRDRYRDEGRSRDDRRRERSRSPERRRDGDARRDERDRDRRRDDKDDGDRDRRRDDRDRDRDRARDRNRDGDRR